MFRFVVGSPAAFLILLISLASTGAAAAAIRTAEFGYAAGTGINTSYVVVDFAQSGGDAYYFTYRWDTPITGYDMLQAVDAAGSFTFFTSVDPTFGPQVDGFGFDGNSQNIGFDLVNGRFWNYFLDGGFQDLNDDSSFTLDEAVTTGAYVGADRGAASRLIADGSVDGWVVNVYAGNPAGNLPTNFIPASIPEPAALLAWTSLACLAMLRRHRREA